MLCWGGHGRASMRWRSRASALAAGAGRVSGHGFVFMDLFRHGGASAAASQYAGEDSLCADVLRGAFGCSIRCAICARLGTESTVVSHAS